MENIMKGTMWVFSILMIGILVSCGNVATTEDPPSEEQTGTIPQEPSPNAFVTRWKITDPGTVITLPLGSYHTTPQPVVYDFTVNWGDGSPEDRIMDLNDAKKISFL